MRKLQFLAWPLLVMSLFACDPVSGDEGEGLSGDDIITFEDENFLKALLEVKDINIYDPESGQRNIPYTVDVDTNRDGKISVNEAQRVRGLEFYDWDTYEGYNNISAMPEIKYFTALEYLSCRENPLNTLDVSNCTALVYLSCSGNQLTSLDVSNNTALTELYCYDNQLTSLDVSNCTALTELYCYKNQLTSLDVSNCTALTELYCYYNQLTELDVSNCTVLDRLDCETNQLTTLDISNNTALENFYCKDNPGLDGKFTVLAWFDGSPSSGYFTNESWTYEGNTINIDYVKK